ncbi:MAG: archaetidylserine decarboxylase [Desulfobacterales bacterium]|nr:archaetidylserine decarboxylase [Desulfobacterales bacterium]
MRTLLTLLSAPALSRIYGRITRIRRPKFLVNALVNTFARVYHIRMDDYPGQPKDYPSLLDFFIRPLDPEKRALKADSKHFLSPADGVLAELQAIDKDQATQVKGWTYKVSQLTGANENWEDGWWLAVVYLSPSNYHRFHYSLDSRLETFRHLGNRLFPVNKAGIRYIKDLFIRNERVTATFTTHAHRFHVVAVGATFVGSIKMNDHPLPFSPGKTVPKHLDIRQNMEMGRFEMGSTLVILLPKQMAEPVAKQGSPVRVGEPLFKLRG